MARLLTMPEVAANATEAVLQDWALEENQSFSVEDVVATVETEKAVVDVEADGAGVLVRRLVRAGSQVRVGAPIALVAEHGETVDDVEAALAELGVSSEVPALAPERRSVPDDPEGGTANTGGPAVGAEVPAPVVDAQGRGQGSAARPAGRIFSSPLVRRIAAERGVDLVDVAGTGPRGRILRRDIDAFLAARESDAGTGAAEADAPVPSSAAPSRTPGEAVTFTEVPHSRMRRAIALRLTQSKQETPHFYLRGTARVDRLLRLREQLNSGTGGKISVNDLVVKAVARAHVEVPAMNVVWQPEALRAFTTVDVAVAVATEGGLVTPVLSDVDSSTVSAVASRTRDLAERARSGRLRQDELEGGTITVTNLGMYGTEEFAAIINPPHAAILAVGAARREAVVKRSGKIATGTVLSVTLSVDHRAVDGAVAADWMRRFVALLENPLQLLA